MSFDYESSSGPQSGLLLGYGDDASAYTVQITPTISDMGYFARLGFSYAHVLNGSAGDQFGMSGLSPTQFRVMTEIGYYF